VALAAAALPATRAAAQPTFAGVWGQRGTELGAFAAPAGLAVNRGDTLFVADSFLDRVTLFDTGGEALSAWNRSGSGPGEIHHPVGLALDAGGDVYIADSGNHRIQRFRRDGGFVEAFGDSGSGPGKFLGPSGIAFGRAGFLYVADHGNRRVVVLDWSRSPPRFDRILGGGGIALAGPTDIALDALDRVYISDFLGNEIVVVDALDREVRRFRGEGTEGEPPLHLGLLVDGDMLHVSDVVNGTMETFDLSGRRLFAWPPGGLPGPLRLAASPRRRLFVSTADSNVYVFQLALPVRSASWSALKGKFR
jgi:hypothetical protein